jgi:hypothetical protein
LYLIFGALPVTFWVMWSPFYFMAMDLIPYIIGISMVLGTAGMYLTFLPTCSNIKFGISICLLLFIGQLTMLYAIFGAFNMFNHMPLNTREYMFYYGTCGPIIVALHYQATFIYQKAFNKQLHRTP